MKYSLHLQSDVMMPMRDGVRLATDIYSPADADGRPVDGPWPVILVRNSYNKTFSEWDGVPDWYVQHGYVFAIQDIRSRYKSEGDGRYYHTCNPWEGDDGYDTVEWLAAQPWCNGKVGMMGSSHRAIVQTQAALHRPPHLKTICPEQGPTNIYLHEAREGGAMALHMYTAIYNHALDAHEIRDDHDAVRQVAKGGLHEARQWLQRMPFKRGEVPLSVAPHLEETLFNYYHRGEYDEWWALECNDQTPYWDRHADIPCLITGGWYDPFVDACTGYFQAMKERFGSASRLIIGPWAHGTMRVRTTALGAVDFGAEAMLGYPAHHELRKRWFDRWLLDEANGVEADAPVEIFVMGGGSGRKTADGLLDHGGRWRSEQEWPIARAERRTLYLTEDGALADRQPTTAAALTYQHDPDHPVPTAGGSIAHLAEIDAPDGGWDNVPPFGDRAAVYGGQGSQIVPWGPIDQREHDWFEGVSQMDASHSDAIHHAAGRALADREDVLVFATAPLAADTEITGQVEVRLWVSSSALDTDFTAKLIDVYPPNDDYPDGFALNLTDTVLRMRYRNSWTDPEMLDPGQIYPITIVLPTTSNLFQTGHRIRVDIASSNFPRLEVNPNTGEPVGRHTHTIVATNAVHIGGDAPSHLALPVVP